MSSWNGGHFEAFWNPAGRVKAICLCGTITFIGTIFVKKVYDFDEVYKIDNEVLSDIINETSSLLKSKMKSAIEEVRKEYKGYDRSYTIKTNITARAVK